MLTFRALRRALEPTLLHLRMLCWNFDIIPKMWKGGRRPRKFQLRPARSHCLFWFEVIRGIGVGNVRACPLRSLHDDSSSFPCHHPGAEENVPVGPLEFDPLCGPSLNWHPPQTATFRPDDGSPSYESPEQLARGQQATYSRCRADANSCVRPFRGVAAAFNNNAQRFTAFRIRITAYDIFLAVCQSDDCISSLLRRLKRL